MKAAIIFVALLALCSTQNFQQYCLKYNKHYSPEQSIRRQAIYLEKMARFAAANQQNSDYTLGQNQFTDLTPQQIQVAAGLKRLYLPNQPTVEPPKRKLKGGLGLPLAIDWRTQGKVSAVKYQGSCGSCWAFTATALYQSLLMIGGLTPQPDLSQQYVLQCTTQNSPNQTESSCNGGILQYAIPFILTNGIPTQTDFPYQATSWTSGGAVTPTTAGICTTTAFVKQTNLAAAYSGSYANLTNLQLKDLVSYAPVAVAMYADPTGFSAYTGGVYTGCPDFATSVGSLNHAVLLIGYDTSGNYIIKNSWGTSWGQDGFATISKDADCGISSRPRQIRGTNPQLLYASHAYLVSVIFFFIASFMI